MPLRVIGIDHIQIAVPEALAGECRAFYRQILGLQEIPKPDELRGCGGAWFQAGPIQLHIGIDPERSPRSRRHICFLVADLDAAKAKIAARGSPIQEENAVNGLSRFFIRDPAGNRLEIGQRA